MVHDPGQSFSFVLATPRARLDRSREVVLVRKGREHEMTFRENGDPQPATDQATAEPAPEEGEVTP